MTGQNAIICLSHVGGKSAGGALEIPGGPVPGISTETFSGFKDLDEMVKGAMTDTPLPDRLSTNPKSPYYNEELLNRGVGIKFDGQEKTNVEEYCVSEGWIRVAVGRTVDRKGNPLTIKLTGKVEPYLQK